MPHRLHIRPARNYAPVTSSRNRVLYAVMAVAVVAAGLLWRSGLIPMPGWLSNNGGDALWALMVFLGFGFLFPRSSTLLVALLALTFSWGVEFSQLYHAPWIDAVRATIPGKLVLGNTFNWLDLPAYALGVGSLFGVYSVKIINEMDRCTRDAQNLLLSYLDRLPPGHAVIGTSNLQLDLLTERFQTRFQSIKLAEPSTEEIATMLRRHWPVDEQTSLRIAVGSGGCFRAALADLESWLDAEGLS